jgi:hypothetical protein
MTAPEDLEARLVRAFDVTPSDDGWRWLDERVARAMAAPVPTGRRLPIRPLVLRPLLVVGAFLLLTGAVAGAVTLLDRLIDDSQPGWRTAWERAEVLDLRQTDAGVTLTLERAYADLNQVAFGISVEGLEPQAEADAATLSWMAELHGPGGWTPDPDAVDSVGRALETDRSAFLVTFGSPPPVGGTWDLTVTSVGYGAGAGGMVDGRWHYQFELPAPAGVALSVDARDTVGNATVTLSELRITPTSVAARLELDVSGDTVAYWSSGTGIADAVRHGGTSFEIIDERLFPATPTVNEYRTSAGSDESSGAWEVVIPALGYTNDGGQNIGLEGPWTISVEVP